MKRIDAELVSAFVIDLETKHRWKSLHSERDVAEDFVQILLDGTLEKCENAKRVLIENDQGGIAELLP